MAISKNKILFNKRMSAFNKKANVKQCLHPNKSDCSKKIIHAHTIQNNRYLSQIVSHVNGENVLIQIKDLVIEGDGIHIKYQGRSKATTFRGFCSNHDSILFEKVEKHKFTHSREQIFLLSYRALCATLHSGQEWIKGHKDDPAQKTTIGNDDIYYGLLFGMLKELQLILMKKRKLDYCLKISKFDILHSYVLKFPSRKIYLACSGVVSTSYSFDNTKFGNLIEDKADIFLTILPDEEVPFAILSCMTADKSGRKFLDSLFQQNRESIEIVLSSMLFFYTDSTVISPILWNEMLNQSERQNLLNIKRKFHSSFTKDNDNEIRFCTSPVNLLKENDQTQNSPNTAAASTG